MRRVVGKKKGQAALEFLMTYGWAIFVILTALAALSYFGIFSLDQFLVEKCTFTAGVICVDHIQEDDGVSFVIQNAMGIDIENVTVVVEGCSNTPLIVATLDSGEQVRLDDTCALDQGAAFKSVIVLNYTNPESLLTHIKRGEIVGRVQ